MCFLAWIVFRRGGMKDDSPGQAPGSILQGRMAMRPCGVHQPNTGFRYDDLLNFRLFMKAS